MPKYPKLICIGGCGRSGTSLLQKLITKHDLVEGGAEFGFTDKIINLYHLMDWHEERGHLSSLIDKEGLKESFKDFYHSFFTSFSDKDPLYISEKTPSNIFVMDKLLRLFPDAKFICIYRDGRAVLSSHIQVRKRSISHGHFNQELGLRRVSDLWNRSIEAQLKWTSSLPTAQLLILKYEDLVTDPSQTIESVLNFLELTEPQKNSPGSGVRQHDSIHVDNIWYTEEMSNQEVTTKHIDKWRQELNAIRKFRGSVIMANNLLKMGYPINRLYLILNRVYTLLRPSLIRQQLSKGIIGRFIRHVRMRLS